ncbi:3344_t:CDS:2 [Ambispora gerdemannii]|uniref:3344_t:CDS:1 n=1 Tax=Ambispora gerdemannii TaxID=144530 RepID=A0A9N8V4X8_9GLOM|nr:3344_t:CDS:2 [Ambispora gerdemannii]
MKFQNQSLICAVTTALLLLSTTTPEVTAQKSWCGKPYVPKKQARDLIPERSPYPQHPFFNVKRASNATDVSGSSGTIILPPQKDPIPSVPDLAKGYAAMARYQPYLDSDSKGSIVVNVVNPNGPISVQIANEDGSELFPKTSINIKDMAVEVPFSISNLKPKLTAYNLKVSIFSGTGNSPASQITVKLYRLPSGPKTVKLDRLYGGIITATGDTIFPTGPYVDFGWLGGGAGVAANLKTLKDLGYNVINPDPTYTDLSVVDQMFQAADKLGGIYIQLSFRYSFTDTQKVVSQVNQFKKYNSLLTWYTADEPDGEQWTDSSAELTAYNAIKTADPYHPVALVLNCEHTAAFYADTTDILSTDVYPIGVDVSHCTETNDVCGCDNCLGSATLDIPKRTGVFMKDLTLIGRQAMNQWMVLQAFSDPPTWWSKMPTEQEYRVMSYISIIYGYKSIMYWKYPFTPNDSLKAQITKLASETTALIPYILQSQQLPSSHLTNDNKNIYSGAWLSTDGKSLLLLVVNGDAKNKVSFKVAVKDLQSSGSMQGNGTTDSGGKSTVTMQNGAVSGNLNAYEVGVYTFGNLPAKITSSLNGGSGSGSDDGSNSSTDPSASASEAKTPSSASPLVSHSLALYLVSILGILASLS